MVKIWPSFGENQWLLLWFVFPCTAKYWFSSQNRDWESSFEVLSRAHNYWSWSPTPNLGNEENYYLLKWSAVKFYQWRNSTDNHRGPWWQLTGMNYDLIVLPCSRSGKSLQTPPEGSSHGFSPHLWNPSTWMTWGQRLGNVPALGVFRADLNVQIWKAAGVLSIPISCRRT